MKTIAVLLICANGMVWPQVVENLHRKNTTVIHKTPGPVIKLPISKPRVVQWEI